MYKYFGRCNDATMQRLIYVKKKQKKKKTTSFDVFYTFCHILARRVCNHAFLKSLESIDDVVLVNRA